MKRKLILLILILILSLLAWRLFLSTFSSGPIEIVPNPTKNLSGEKTKISGINDTVENLKDNLSDKKAEPKEKIVTKEETEKTTTEKKIPEVKATDNFIINKKTSWGYSSSSGRTIDTIVVHSSYDALGSDPYDLNGLIAEYKQYSVAPHFLIDRKGKVYRLVDEKNIAYHAGVSKMPDGRTGVNNFSIGIEMMNTKNDDYTSKQYSGLNNLIDYLEDQYKIKYVLGHKDISPDRKTDPWNFDWKEVNSDNTIH